MQPVLILAAAASAAAAALLLPAPSARLVRAVPADGRGGGPGEPVHGPVHDQGRGPGRRSGRRSGSGLWRGGRRAALLGLGAVGGTLALGSLPGTTLGVLLVGLGAAAAASRLAARARRQRQSEERRRAVVDYCEALLGELRAGQPVPLAVERAVEAWPATQPVASAARLGADVPAALRALGAEPGAGGLLRLAAAWELCAATGAGLAVAVERLLESATEEQALHRLVTGELASARATAWLVALLPVVVLLAAQGIGGRPWHFLLATPAGVVCLGAGAGLVAAGLFWIERIALRAVEGG